MPHRIMSLSALILYTLGTICNGETVIIGLPTQLLMPKIESARILTEHGEILEKVDIVAPAKLPAKKT